MSGKFMAQRKPPKAILKAYGASPWVTTWTGAPVRFSNWVLDQDRVDLGQWRGRKKRKPGAVVANDLFEHKPRSALDVLRQQTPYLMMSDQLGPVSVVKGMKSPIIPKT